jgi:Flp pilus assembly protein TadD
MQTHQEQYDDAMYDFSMGDFDACIAKLAAILAENPEHFDAQLSLGMAYCRKGDFARAIEEGHKAEKLQPNEQLVHTNLSLFYMRAGNKQTAERHGLQARVASWRGNMAAPATQPANADDPELKLAQPPPPPVKIPDQPWNKKKT